MLTWISEFKTALILDVTKFSKDALEGGCWGELAKGEQRSASVPLNYAAEELIANSFYYGLLKLTSDERRCFFSTADTPERQAVFAKVEAALTSPGAHSFMASFSVEFGSGTLRVTTYDDGHFPGFEHQLEDVERARNAEVVDVRTIGRGLDLIVGMFDRVRRDPDSKALVWEKDSEATKERAKRMYAEPDAAKEGKETSGLL
ncbi:MAG: hypothetical protein J0M12_08590 [Deltaproteobacteria bacterium]|nr:hypothetical protein [Deltaproteobacteria bacterium]